jgi:hypothetical protein
MFYKIDKYFYTRNKKVSIIISLLIIILLFQLFPKIKFSNVYKPIYNEPFINVIEIPQTSFYNNIPPSTPLSQQISNILKPIDDIMLEDIDTINVLLNSDLKSSIQPSKLNSSGIVEASSLSFIPRQILEVVPEKVNGAEGIIKLKLLIGIDGRVIQHSILSDLSSDKKCLVNVINAIYKSKWQPIFFDGEKVEYWLEKTYSFN